MRAGVSLEMLLVRRRWRVTLCRPRHCISPPPETDCLSLLRGERHTHTHTHTHITERLNKGQKTSYRFIHNQVSPGKDGTSGS